eukprot:2463310-Rhodomonas_salina.1
MLRYCFFGDTVTIARGMENTGFAMNVQVSYSTRSALELQMHSCAMAGECCNQGEARGPLGAVGHRVSRLEQHVWAAFVIKESRCAWESALKKAELVVLDQVILERVLFFACRHNIPRRMPLVSPTRALTSAARERDASKTSEHVLGRAAPAPEHGGCRVRYPRNRPPDRQFPAMLSDVWPSSKTTGRLDLTPVGCCSTQVKEKLSNFVSTKRSMPPALTPPIHSPPRSVVDGPAGSVSGVTMAVAQKLEMERKDNEIHDLELKQEQTSGQIIQAERKIKDLERMLAEALLKVPFLCSGQDCVLMPTRNLHIRRAFALFERCHLAISAVISALSPH